MCPQKRGGGGGVLSSYAPGIETPWFFLASGWCLFSFDQLWTSTIRVIPIPNPPASHLNSNLSLTSQILLQFYSYSYILLSNWFSSFYHDAFIGKVIRTQERYRPLLACFTLYLILRVCSCCNTCISPDVCVCVCVRACVSLQVYV